MGMTAGEFKLWSVAGDELRPELEVSDHISATLLSFSEPSLIDDWSQELRRKSAPEAGKVPRGSGSFK